MYVCRYVHMFVLCITQDTEKSRHYNSYPVDFSQYFNIGNRVFQLFLCYISPIDIKIDWDAPFGN